MAIRKRSLNPDALGRYRPYIGWRFDLDGVRRQHRFNLGTDRREAERRYRRIQELYTDDCRDSGKDLWSPRGLKYAEQLASGVATIQVGPPPSFDERAIIEYQQGIEHYRQWFPSLDIAPSDPVVYSKSVEQNQSLVTNELKDLELKLKRMGALLSKDSIPEKFISGTFHEALLVYESEIKRDSPKVADGAINQTGRKRIERVNRLKERHADFPLYELNRDRIAELIGYWRNRPLTKRMTVMAYDTARIHLEEFDRFISWLDDSEKFRWVMPKGAKKITRRIVKFDSEKQLSAVVKPTYTPEQLGAINRTATERERLALYLGLNCAMGAAELGRLTVNDFLLNTPHPLARKLGLRSSSNDSWLRCIRPKTDVFGEWILWPETVELVRWAIARARRIGTDLIFCRETGAPLFDEAISKPDAGFANLWRKSFDRAKAKESNLPWLPLGSLRDTLPDYLWKHHDSELASMCVAHGSPSPDKLMECYANRPFARFHRAVKASRKFYASVFRHHRAPALEEA